MVVNYYLGYLWLSSVERVQYRYANFFGSETIRECCETKVLRLITLQLHAFIKHESIHVH